MNKKFQNAILGRNTAAPPIWFMRQAGRYHSHYQNLRAKHSFMDLCKVPELAAEVALGPIQDFDFDVAILFSDLLFPLETLGMGLEYTDHGPKLAWKLNPSNLNDLKSAEDALEGLLFQKEAVRLTRQILPKEKSLVGFVGGPWTLFVYACEGSHLGGLTLSKNQIDLYPQYLKTMLPLLTENIRIQLEGGAEIIYIFDTAAGELSPTLFKNYIQPGLLQIANLYPGKIAYYSKSTHSHFFTPEFLAASWAGLGFDHRVNLPHLLKNKPNSGYLQGNFDQNLLLAETDLFEREFEHYLEPFTQLPKEALQSWVCGLGHGVLPKTPEKHVRHIVDRVRKAFL